MVVQPIRETIGEPVREICFISEVLEIGYVIVQIEVPAFYRLRSIPPAKIWIIPVVGHTEYLGDHCFLYSVSSHCGQHLK